MRLDILAPLAPAFLVAGLACTDRTPVSRSELDLLALEAGWRLQIPTHQVDLGHPSAAPLLVRNWLPVGHREDLGAAVAWSLGEGAELELFVPEPQELEVRFRCSPASNLGRPLRLSMNGTDEHVERLENGMFEYRYTVPADALRPGLNRFGIAHRSADGWSGSGKHDVRVLWDYVRFGEAEGSPVPPSVDRERQLLLIPFGTRVDLHLGLDPGSRLEVDRIRTTAGAGGRLLVGWQPLGGAERPIAELAPASDLRLDLGIERPSPGRLTLYARASGGSPPSGDGLALSRPRLQLPPAAPPAPRATRIDPRPAPLERPNLLLYLIDTLRADHVGAYGYGRPVSPHIDRLADDGVLFENAQAQSPWTRSSVASLLTGLWPQSHGANDDQDVLAGEAETLAELLAEHGYRTAAFLANGNVGAKFGFAQGFETFLHVEGATSAELNREVFAWLAEHGDGGPFFLYVHTIDPHAPYDPPADLRHRFAAATGAGELGSVAFLNELELRPQAPTAETLAALVDLYDAEIAANDRSFGELRAELERLGLDRTSVIALVSDHGEEFFEHGRLTHGKTLYSEVLDVPLILQGPGLAAGRRLPQLVQHVDLLPTLLELSGREPPPELPGRSLLPLLAGEGAAWQDRALAHLRLRGITMSSLLRGDWKAIQLHRQGFDSFPELYDRRHDPGERHNLADERSGLAWYLATLRSSEETQAAARRLDPPAAEIDAELRRELEALGYLD